MLRILSSPDLLHPTLNRRDLIRVGMLGSSAVSTGSVWAEDSASSSLSDSFSAAKQVLLLYLQGAASQFETWDPRPDAPAEIRGKWAPASTAVPGTFICEKLPKLARLTDRMAIVRSMTHKYNNHSNLYTLSGYPAVDFGSETNPFDSRHHPFFGSVLDYLADQRGNDPVRDIPRTMGLPFRFTVLLEKVVPQRATRALMAWLSRD